LKFSDTKPIKQSILDIGQACNQLGTTGGEEFSERETNFWKTFFQGVRRVTGLASVNTKKAQKNRWHIIQTTQRTRFM